MSILSSEEVCDFALNAKIIEKTHAIDIDIEFSNTIQVTPGQFGGFLGAGGMPIGNVAPPIQAVDAVNYNNIHVNAASNFTTTSYRLFFEKGFLKCIRREVAAYTIYTNSINSTATSPLVSNILLNFNHNSKKKPYKNSLYFPCVVNNVFGGNRIMEVIIAKLIALAARKNVKVPKKFLFYGKQSDTAPEGYLSQSKSFCPMLDWLAFPLIREINSVPVAIRLTDMQRKIIAPIHKSLNFKALVEHYYGTSTNKMLDEIWNVLTVGGDFRVNRISHEALLMIKPEDILRNGYGPIIRKIGNSYYQYGDRHIQKLVFTLGPPIHKTMGFDYLYQALPTFGAKKDIVTPDYTMPAIINSTESSIKTLLRFLAPKKLINKMCADAHNISHFLGDTARMLDEYNTVDKIPNSLKEQYPQGLTVDFKFKTLKELHDKISTQYTIIKAEAAKKDIPVHPIYARLNGLERDGIRLVVPYSTAPLAMWGKTLSICVASYGDRAALGQTLLMGVEKNGEIKYCIEFSSRRVEYYKPAPHTGGMVVGNELPIDAPIAEKCIAALPNLVEKQSMVPADVSEEEGVYYIPSIYQFRTKYNRDPSAEDKKIVEDMLAQWTHENKEELNKAVSIDKSSYSYNIQAIGGNGMPINIGNNNVVINNIAY